MRRLLWFGLLFLSMSWLYFIPIFTPPVWEYGLIFLAVGIALNIFGLWKIGGERWDRRYFVLLIPICMSVFFIPYPYNLGLILIGIGMIIYTATYIINFKKIIPISIGISLSGLILTIHASILPFYIMFASRYHRADFLSPLVSFCGTLLGLKSSVNNGIVFVQTTQRVFPFTTTWEKLALYPWVNFFIGCIILFFLMSPNIKKTGVKILGVFVLSAGYLLIRYILFIYLFVETNNISIFWDTTYLTLSFIPLPFLLVKFCPLNIKNLEENLNVLRIFKINKNRFFAMITIFIFIFSLIGAKNFQDPGSLKKGRILIDELHSDWENTTKKLDKDWYGEESVYNYYCLADWLDYYYSVDINLNKTMDSELLENYDILIVKCPTNPFSDKEIKAIVQFVENGGGLFLIGDHTNVFGMNFYLNTIAKNFGIRFNFDSTNDLTTGRLSLYESSELLPHPIVQDTPSFDFMTSCSLDAPLTAEEVIVGYSLSSQPGDYSTEYFFRKTYLAPDTDYGLFLQMVAVKHGKGRVVAFTDSTCFSNFAVFMRGNPTLILGTMSYLNRSNQYPYLNTVFFGIAILSLCLTIYLLRKERKLIAIFLVLFIGSISFSSAVITFSQINKGNYSLPAPHTRFTKICFVEDHSDAQIFVVGKLEPTEKTYETFFVWTQRIGCVSSIEKNLDNALKKGDVVVIINPVKSFTKEETDSIVKYVEGGGKVLLMDGLLNTQSTANQLLPHFGMWIKYGSDDHVIVNTTEENNLTVTNLTVGNMSTPVLTILGGKPVLVTKDGRTMLSISKQGKGVFAVLVDSYTFSNSIMGGSFTIPDQHLRNIYDIEYYIFEEVLLI